MSKARARRRNALHAADPRCYWCDVVTVLPTPGDSEQRATYNMATVDHLDSRDRDGRRVPSSLRTEDGSRTVLACHDCNTTRGCERWVRGQRMEYRKATLEHGCVEYGTCRVCTRGLS